MLNKILLDQNLKHCQDIYASQKDFDKKKLILKLALLDACGWIEECLDSLYREIKLNSKLYQDEREKLIQRIYAFDAKTIKDTLVILIGMVSYEKLESSLNPSVWEKAKSSLGTLKKERDRYAHTTYEDGQDYMGISSIKSNIENIIEGIAEIEIYLLKNGFVIEKDNIPLKQFLQSKLLKALRFLKR